MRISTWLGAVLAVALLAATAPRSWAANDNEEDDKGGTTASSVDARKKYAEGNEKFARGDYDGAIEAFKAAIALEPKLPGPYRNLALAYRALNRCADALPNYEKYLEIKPESRYTERVRREIDLCRAKLGQTPSPTRPSQSGGNSGYHPAEAQSYLHVAANLIGGEATDEASVRIDGLVRGSTPITIPITSGKHRIHLERLGFENADTSVDVAPGQRQEVELTMNKLGEEPKPVVTAPVEEEKKPGPKGAYRKYGWVLVGVAGGLAGMGLGFGIAESKLHADAVTADHLTTSRDDINKKRDTGSNYAAGAYVGLAAGGAALAAGIILFIIDPSRSETHEKQKYVLTPTVGAGSAGVAAAGSF